MDNVIKKNNAAEQTRRSAEQREREERERLERIQRDEQARTDQHREMEQAESQMSRDQIIQHDLSKREDLSDRAEMQRQDHQRRQEMQRDDEQRKDDMRRDDDRRQDDLRREHVKRAEQKTEESQEQAIEQQVDFRQAAAERTKLKTDQDVSEEKQQGQAAQGRSSVHMTDMKNVLDPKDLAERETLQGKQRPHGMTEADIERERAHSTQSAENRAYSASSAKAIIERNRATAKENEAAGKTKPPAATVERGKSCEAGLQKAQEQRVQREQARAQEKVQEKELAR